MTSSIASSKLPLRLLLDTSQQDQRKCWGGFYSVWVYGVLNGVLSSHHVVFKRYHWDCCRPGQPTGLPWFQPWQNTDRRRQFQEPTNTKHHVSKINFIPRCKTQKTKALVNKKQKHIRQKCKMTDNHVLWVWTMSHPPFIVYCLSDEQHWTIQLICQALNYKRRITFQLAHFAYTRHKTTVCEIMCFLQQHMVRPCTMSNTCKHYIYVSIIKRTIHTISINIIQYRIYINI